MLIRLFMSLKQNSPVKRFIVLLSIGFMAALPTTAAATCTPQTASKWTKGPNSLPSPQTCLYVPRGDYAESVILVLASFKEPFEGSCFKRVYGVIRHKAAEFTGFVCLSDLVAAERAHE